MEIVNILMIGAGRRVSLAEKFLHAGRLIGIEVRLFSYEITEDVPIAFVSNVIVGKRWKDRNFEKHLVRTIKKFDIHIVVPLMDEATVLLSKINKTLDIDINNTMMFVSDHELCSVLFNKRSSSDWFARLGIPTPEMSAVEYPKVIKDVFGFGARGMMIVENKEELEIFLAKRKKLEYFVQPFINGLEYTVDSYVGRDGDIKAIVPRVRMEVRGGEVSVSMTVKQDKVIEMAREILKKGKFCGPICLQFIEEKSTKDLYAIEINPRFGGGVINSIEAGVNMPLFVIKEFLGQEVEPVLEFEANLEMMRADREFFKCK